MKKPFADSFSQVARVRSKFRRAGNSGHGLISIPSSGGVFMSATSIIIMSVIMGTAHGSVSVDGSCPILFLLPFTPPIQHDSFDSGLFDEEMLYFINLASAVLAINHANARDGSVVPAFASPDFQTCHVSIPHFAVLDSQQSADKNGNAFNLNLTDVVSKGRSDEYNVQMLPGFDAAVTRGVFEDGGYDPSVVIGPLRASAHHMIGTTASANQMSFDIPQISPSAVGLSRDLKNELEHPYFARMVSSSNVFAQALMDYLLDEIERDFIGVVYPANAFGRSIWEDFKRLAGELNVTVKGVEFEVNSTDAEVDNNGPSSASSQSQSMHTALSSLKETKFLTFVAVVETNVQVEKLIVVANSLDMCDDDALWLMHSREALMPTSSALYAANGSPLDNFVRGLGYLVPSIDDNGAFVSSLKSQNSSFVQQVVAASPAKFGMNNYFGATDNFFQQEFYSDHIYYEGGYIYDAVAAAVLGACEARKSSASSMTGAQHLDEILALNVTGATGTIAFDRESRSRSSYTMSFSMLNGQVLMDQYGSKDVLTFGFVTTAVRKFQEWVSFENFVFSNGSTKPHTPLRDVEEIKIYTFTSFQYMSLVLGSLGLLASVVCFALLWRYRSSHVVRAWNPLYLLLLNFGTAVTFIISMFLQFNENMGFSTLTLNHVCASFGVLRVVVLVLCIVPIYAKLKWLNLSIIERQDTTYGHFLIMPFICSTPLWIVTVYKQWIDGLEWTTVNVEVDEYGFIVESYARCEFGMSSNQVIDSIGPLCVFIVTAWMCRYTQQTRLKIEHETREGKNIFFVLLYLSQFSFLYALCSNVPWKFWDSGLIFTATINNILFGFVKLMWIVYPPVQELVRSLYERHQESFEGRSIDISVIDGVEELSDDDVSGLTNCHGPDA